jgi:hypothetical protein
MPMVRCVARLLAAALLLAVAESLQCAGHYDAVHRHTATTSRRAATPMAFDLYPKEEDAAAASKRTQDFFKLNKPMDSEMLKAAGFGDSTQKKTSEAQSPVDLGPVLAGVAVVLAVVFATQS